MSDPQSSTRLRQSAKPAPRYNSQKINTVLVVALGCVCCLIFVLLSRAYRSLQHTILLERIDYVEEISTQIMNSQLFMEKEYTQTVINLAGILEREPVANFNDVHQYINSKEKQEILLVSEGNDVVDLTGKQISMPDNKLMQKMLGGTGVTEMFTSLDYEVDSWLFAAPITPKEIGGTVYKAVILSVSADQFRDNLSIALFDEQGATYIINNDGRIKIKPLNENLAFNGFNLFASMLEHGVAKEDVSDLENALLRLESGSALIQAGKLDWLVSYTPIDEETSIIVAVPLTLTAAQTYEGLSDIILLSALSICLVAVIALLLIWRFFRRDRVREREAMAVAAKSEFFSKMSHDIRTPLNAVIGLMLLARDCTDDPKTVKEYLEQSFSAAKYLLSIINDVLDMSRIESGKLTLDEAPFAMSDLLNDVINVVEPLAEEKGLSFTAQTEGFANAAYIADQVRIKQILTNLLSNAAKFTKSGGQIGLQMTCDAGAEGFDNVKMVVSDTGIGMSEQYLTRIFTPFEQEHSSYTKQYAGSGLGLAIVHSLVQLMGGTISVTSRLEEGSVFTVVLPLRRGENIVQRAQMEAPGAMRFDGKRVLLAEDNEVNQMIAAKILASKFGIIADTASDGDIALNMFAASAPGTYDMILMDVKMPNMDGLAATRAIRALNRPDANTIPIIALSANAYNEDVQLSIAAGMNDHLSKPLEIETMARIFHSYLDEARA